MELDSNRLIKNKGNGHNSKKEQTTFMEKMTMVYYKQSLIQGVMKYDVLYEKVAEGGFSSLKSHEELENFNNMIGEIFRENPDLDHCARMLDAFRNEIMDKMDILTCYTDSLTIYEYVLNRQEYRYEKLDSELGAHSSDMVFLQQLMNYIFSVKDNFVVNERVKEVIGQLPVRMTKSRFLDLVKNSLSLYKEADLDSLETYLYMIRTSAGLYIPEASGKYYIWLKEIMDNFSKLDYDSMEKEEYQRMTDILEKTGESIRTISDYLVSIQEIVNQLYTYVLMKPVCSMKDSHETELCIRMFQELRKLFVSDGSQIGMEETVNHNFIKLEGFQESLVEKLAYYEAGFEELSVNFVQDGKLSDWNQRLKKANMLMKTSLFVKLDFLESRKVDEMFLKEEMAQLIREFQELFYNSQRKIIRAVMACSISKMPVFFSSVQEINDYIENSLFGCRDVAEKKACMDIIKNIIEEA